MTDAPEPAANENINGHDAEEVKKNAERRRLAVIGHMCSTLTLLVFGASLDLDEGYESIAMVNAAGAAGHLAGLSSAGDEAQSASFLKEMQDRMMNAFMAARLKTDEEKKAEIEAYIRELGRRSAAFARLQEPRIVLPRGAPTRRQ